MEDIAPVSAANSVERSKRTKAETTNAMALAF